MPGCKHKRERRSNITWSVSSRSTSFFSSSSSSGSSFSSSSSPQIVSLRPTRCHDRRVARIRNDSSKRKFLPVLAYADHYLGRMMPIVSFVKDQRFIVSQDELLLSCQLSCAALWVHVKRSSQPQPPFPHFISMQPQLLPLHLQRFLRGFVLATAHQLVIPPASLLRLVHARTKSRWSDRIFVRVMSGFVRKAEVRRKCSRFACACACRAAPTHLLPVLAWIDTYFIDAIHS